MEISYKSTTSQQAYFFTLVRLARSLRIIAIHFHPLEKTIVVSEGLAIGLLWSLFKPLGLAI